MFFPTVKTFILTCFILRPGEGTYLPNFVLYGPANDPQIVPQMIPGPELIPPQKVKNGEDSMKSLWMDTFFLIILGEEKTSTSGIKAEINT